MKPVLLMLISIVLLSSLGGCYYDKADLLYPFDKVPCDTSVVAKFSSDVLPEMNASCNTSGCHDAAAASGGVILDNYNGIKTQALNGRLMGSINQTGAYSAMPKGGAKLSSCTITKIQQWINSGAPQN
jgi:hypothetical protein